MKIRRLLYQIDYYHILTFKDQYQDIVNSYFPFENLEYAIDNENSINEQCRLIFKRENIAIVLSKQSLVFLFEGDVSDLKNQNGAIKIFWEIYEKIKGFKNYTKSTKHTILANAVDIKSEEIVNGILDNNKYFTINPFGKIEEFSCNYEFKEKEIAVKFSFGNYTEKDILKQDLIPFKTKFNEDLVNNVGLMSRIEVSEFEKIPSFSKFKTLLIKTEQFLSHFD